MLPSHLQLSPDPKSRPSDPTTPHEFIPTHPLGLTGVICRSFTLTRDKRRLHYTLYRPRHLTLGPPPLFGIAGGPGLPCQYLSALVHIIEDRAIVLYDHVGCGQSIYKGEDAYDLSEMLEDLESLIADLKCPEFHLLGHSFGGLLAYEYAKKHQSSGSSGCLSVVLSNTPHSVSEAQKKAKELQEELRETEDDAAGVFFKRYECLVSPIPLPLQQSLESAGFTSSVNNKQGFSGCVEDYVAKETVSNIPALLLQGQHDYVKNVRDWQDVFVHGQTEYIMLAGCAHYGMLENEGLFGSVVLSFLKQNEPPPKPLVLPRPPDDG